MKTNVMEKSEGSHNRSTAAKQRKKIKRRSSRIAMISTHGYVAAEPPLGAPDTGGQVVYVLELSKVLAQKGFKVDIFTRRFEDQPEEESVAPGVRVVRIPCGGTDFIPKEYMIDFIPEWADNAQLWMKKNKLKYRFINSHYWDAGWAGQLLAERLKTPHVHTPHSLGSWKKENMQRDYPESTVHFEEKYNFTRRIATEQLIYNKCDSLVATTPIQQEIMARDYKLTEDEIAMIPPGYDDNRFYPMGDASRDMIKDDLGFHGRAVFALSRLAHNKGLDLLVEGFALMHQRGVDAELYLAIGHDDRNNVEEEIYQDLLARSRKHGIEEKIHFLGFIPDEKLPEYYQAADIFVLSSRYEPFGMTAVEAMACGTPTLVTRHGGLCRVLQDGVQAMVSDPFDPEELAMDMSVLFRHDGLAQQISYAGSQLARERFSWSEIASQITDLVEDSAFSQKGALSLAR